jgi:hypothetical protein
MALAFANLLDKAVVSTHREPLFFLVLCFNIAAGVRP